MTDKRMKTSTIFTVFIILLCILLLFSIVSPVHRWGDASTYYMQISSIVEDHDIQYQPIDLQRALQNKFDDLPTGVFLIRTAPEIYFFGKDFSYALFTAPFFILFGIHGILIFNALMFFSMILLGFLYLRKKGNTDIIALGTSILFFTLSTAFVYLFWLHPDIYNMFLLTSGLFLWTKYYEKSGNEHFLFCSAFIFGLATVSRIPNGLLFMPFIFFEIYSRSFRRALSLFILFLIPLLLFYGFFYSVTGVTSFYGGDQSYYSSNYPFTNASTSIAGQNIPATVELGQHGMSMGNSWVDTAERHLIFIDYLNGLNNSIYYFFGKFTGIIWYYPLAVFSLLSFLIFGITTLVRDQSNNYPISELKRNPTQYLILIGIILNILFFLFVNGSNYFGGQHAVGNRYFWVYPAFLFLIGRVNLKLIIPFILIALVTVLPIISDPVGNSQNPQNHTFALPYPLFPLEHNQIKNLPLWFPQPDLQNISIIYTDSEGGVVPRYLGSNTYSISGNSHWIFQKKLPIDQVTMLFTTVRKEDSNVSVIFGKYNQEIKINYKKPGMMIIPLKQPKYYSNNQLNKISIGTTSEIKMQIICNESKNKEVLFSDGWFGEEKDNWGSPHWMTNSSTLLVYSDYEQNKNMQFETLSFNRPQTLQIQVDGSNLEYEVNPENYSTITSPLHLHAGYSVILFNALEGCTCPTDIAGLNSTDTRCLSIQVRNMTFTKQLPSHNESVQQEIQYSEGWFGEEKDNWGSSQWMTNHSTLLIYSGSEQNKSIHFETLSFNRPQNLHIQVDGNSLQYEVNPENYSTITSPLHLHAGYTTLQFNASDGCISPSDVIGLNNNDTRCLSLQVRNMTFTEQLPSPNESVQQKIRYSEGWFGEETDDNGSWQWMTNRSTLLIYSDREQNKTIQFDGLSYNSVRNLTIQGDGYYQVYKLNPETYLPITSSIHLKTGYNTLQLDASDGCTCSSDIIGMNSSDTRCLSIRVQNMTVS